MTMTITGTLVLFATFGILLLNAILQLKVPEGLRFALAYTGVWLVLFILVSPIIAVFVH